MLKHVFAHFLVTRQQRDSHTTTSCSLAYEWMDGTRRKNEWHHGASVHPLRSSQWTDANSGSRILGTSPHCHSVVSSVVNPTERETKSEPTNAFFVAAGVGYSGSKCMSLTGKVSLNAVSGPSHHLTSAGLCESNKCSFF